MSYGALAKFEMQAGARRRRVCIFYLFKAWVSQDWSFFDLFCGQSTVILVSFEKLTIFKVAC